MDYGLDLNPHSLLIKHQFSGAMSWLKDQMIWALAPVASGQRLQFAIENGQADGWYTENVRMVIFHSDVS